MYDTKSPRHHNVNIYVYIKVPEKSTEGGEI